MAICKGRAMFIFVPNVHARRNRGKGERVQQSNRRGRPQIRVALMLILWSLKLILKQQIKNKVVQIRWLPTLGEVRHTADWLVLPLKKPWGRPVNAHIYISLNETINQLKRTAEGQVPQLLLRMHIGTYFLHDFKKIRKNNVLDSPYNEETLRP